MAKTKRPEKTEAGPSSLLHDLLSGYWVVSAPKRNRRPHGIKKKAHDPFSAQSMTQEHVLAVYGRGAYRVTAIENKFPVFEPRGGVKGRQEILVEGTGKEPFSIFSAARIAKALTAMAARARAMRRDKGIKYVVVFKNEGDKAGATQPHPHTQLFGLSFVPEHAKLMERRRDVMARRGMTLHALAFREATPERIIYSDKFVVAYANPASRFAYEVRIVPRRKMDNVTQARPKEILSMAKALSVLFPLINERGLSYNMYFHDVIADTNEHFELAFVPRSNVWGGFELDADVTVNPVSPERACEDYKAAKTTHRKR